MILLEIRSFLEVFLPPPAIFILIHSHITSFFQILLFNYILHYLIFIFHLSFFIIFYFLYSYKIMDLDKIFFCQLQLTSLYQLFLAFSIFLALIYSYLINITNVFINSKMLYLSALVFAKY